MALEVLQGPVISKGESLSDGIEVTGPLVRITMPHSWTPAHLTFQVSSDGEGYNDLMDVHGKDVMIQNIAPGSAVRIPLEWSVILGFLKLRSGTRDHPVIQDERREFALAIEAAPEG